MTVVDDIKTELGVAAASVTDEQIALWVKDANMLIDVRAARLGRQVNEEARDYVVRLVVAEHARRPGAEQQISTRIDDGQVQRVFSTGAGRVQIPDDSDLWDLLGLSEPACDGEWSGSFAYEHIPSGLYANGHGRLPAEYRWPG